MNWRTAEKRKKADTVEGRLFQGLNRLEQIRKTEKVFVSYADTWTIETKDPAVLCMGRYCEGEKMIGLFNFSESNRRVWFTETDGEYMELLSGEYMKQGEVIVPAYGFYYLKRTDKAK